MASLEEIERAWYDVNKVLNNLHNTNGINASGREEICIISSVLAWCVRQGGNNPVEWAENIAKTGQAYPFLKNK